MHFAIENGISEHDLLRRVKAKGCACQEEAERARAAAARAQDVKRRTYEEREEQLRSELDARAEVERRGRARRAAEAVAATEARRRCFCLRSSNHSCCCQFRQAPAVGGFSAESVAASRASRNGKRHRMCFVLSKHNSGPVVDHGGLHARRCCLPT